MGHTPEHADAMRSMRNKERQTLGDAQGRDWVVMRCSSTACGSSFYIEEQHALGTVDVHCKLCGALCYRMASEPSVRDLNDTAFNAIWEAIKHWDIKRPGDTGYHGATGTDAKHVLTHLRTALLTMKYPTAWAYEQVCSAKDYWQRTAARYYGRIPELEATLTTHMEGRAEAIMERNIYRAQLNEALDILNRVPAHVLATADFKKVNELQALRETIAKGNAQETDAARTAQAQAGPVSEHGDIAAHEFRHRDNPYSGSTCADCGQARNHVVHKGGRVVTVKVGPHRFDARAVGLPCQVCGHGIEHEIHKSDTPHPFEPSGDGTCKFCGWPRDYDKHDIQP